MSAPASSGTTTGPAFALARLNASGVLAVALYGSALLLDGTRAMTGALNMGSQKVTSLANGTDSGDAVNKGQLDAAVGVSGAYNSGAAYTVDTTLTGASKIAIGDATSGNVVFTLPSGSDAHSPQIIKRIDATYASGNTVSYVRAGSDKIDGGTAGGTLYADKEFVKLEWSGSTNGWIVTA